MQLQLLIPFCQEHTKADRELNVKIVLGFLNLIMGGNFIVKSHFKSNCLANLDLLAMGKCIASCVVQAFFAQE